MGRSVEQVIVSVPTASSSQHHNWYSLSLSSTTHYIYIYFFSPLASISASQDSLPCRLSALGDGGLGCLTLSDHNYCICLFLFFVVVIHQYWKHLRMLWVLRVAGSSLTHNVPVTISLHYKQSQLLLMVKQLLSSWACWLMSMRGSKWPGISCSSGFSGTLLCAWWKYSLLPRNQDL